MLSKKNVNPAIIITYFVLKIFILKSYPLAKYSFLPPNL